MRNKQEKNTAKKYRYTTLKNSQKKKTTMVKLSVFEDVPSQHQQANTPSTHQHRDDLSQSDAKWFTRSANYHHLSELEIYPRVFLGSQWEAKDPSWFATHRISHVLNVSSLQNTFQKKALFYPTSTTFSSFPKIGDSENINPNIMNSSTSVNNQISALKQSSAAATSKVNINYLKINVDDSTDVKISKHFDKAINFVKGALESSPTNHILIHW